MLAAGFLKLSNELRVSLLQISYLVGGMMMALAVGSFFALFAAILFGKRGVYLVRIVIFFLGCIICATSSTFVQLLIGRVVSGLGISTVESLPAATVSEIYFAHERAYRLGIYLLLFLGGKNLMPFIVLLVFETGLRKFCFGFWLSLQMLI